MAEVPDDEQQYAEHFEIWTHYNRGYQRVAVEDNAYLVPIDEDEYERLVIQHEVFYMMFDQRIIFPELRRAPRRVLDCGFGTGHWCWQVKQLFPDCEVRGIDVNPTMVQSSGLSGVNLEVWNLNNNFDILFEPDDVFDLINSRMVAGGIDRERWRPYLRDIHKALRRHGWCQMVEVYFNAQSFNGSLNDNSALRQWSKKYLEVMELCGKNPRAPIEMRRHMERAGFRDIQSTTLNLPMCGWHINHPQRSFHRDHFAIGQANEQNVFRLLYSLALLPFTEHLGLVVSSLKLDKRSAKPVHMLRLLMRQDTRMNITEFETLIEQARAEASNPALQPYFAVYVCIGRKGG